jgi:hypothetical protein
MFENWQKFVEETKKKVEKKKVKEASIWKQDREEENNGGTNKSGRS